MKATDAGGTPWYPADRPEEPLPDGATLMLCGEGVGSVDGTTITASLVGRIFKRDQGSRRQICSDTFAFTFERTPAADLSSFKSQTP